MSVTLHTDTTVVEVVDVHVLTVEETGLPFIACEIADVTILMSCGTAPRVIDRLRHVLTEAVLLVEGQADGRV